MMFRLFGARRTRFVAQVVAAVVGAGFVIGLQVGAILSYGTMSRIAVLQSAALLRSAPGLESVVWWPARAALGEVVPLIAVLAGSFAALAAAIAIVAPRFAGYALAAAGAGRHARGSNGTKRLSANILAARNAAPQGMDVVAARSLAGFPFHLRWSLPPARIKQGSGRSLGRLRGLLCAPHRGMNHHELPHAFERQHAH